MTALGRQVSVGGHTRPYAVLGHPVGHTLSPAMHNASFAALGLDAIYLAFDVAPEHLGRVLETMRHMGFGGVNVTVPLKEIAFQRLRDLDPSAGALGAVNTVEMTARGVRGHNTDGAGFLRALREAFGLQPRGMNVCLLGCGGAGRAVAVTCAREGAARLSLADLDPSRPERLAGELERTCPGLRAHPLPPDKGVWCAAAREADLVVQATPVGMRRDDPELLPVEAFRAGQTVFDLVYIYPRTAFMDAAATAGARVANGLGMLVHQGARAFQIWTGNDPDVSAMRAALEKAVYKDHA